MRGTGAWQRRIFAVAAIALALMVIAPELAATAGAAPARVQLVAKRKLTRKQQILAVMRARGKARAAARARAGLPPRTYTSGKAGATGAAKAGAAGAPKKAGATGAAGAATVALRRARLRRALAARRAKKGRRAGVGAITPTVGKKKKAAPLSIPELALIAIAPFVFIGCYLLIADRMRNPPAPKRRRRRRVPSLVITRVGDR